jgi:hypothetical protein
MQTTEKQSDTPKTRCKSGTPKHLKSKLWRSIGTLARMVETAGNEALQIKAATALAGLAGTWIRAHEQSDLEKRLQALEAKGGEE